MTPETGWPDYRHVEQYINRRIVDTSNPQLDTARLIAALGGNAAVAAFYDCRSGITQSGGSVSSWADVRGAGFGPTLTQGTQAKQPTVASDGSLAFQTASTQFLSCAANALFNIGGTYSLIAIGSIPGTGTILAYLCAIGDASTAFLGITQLGASQLWGAKGGGVVIQQQTACSTVPNYYRVVSATLISTTSLGVQVPRSVVTTQVIGTVNASASEILCVGGYSTGNATMTGNVRAVICMPSAVAGPTITSTVLPWAQPAHNVQAF